MKHLDLYSGFGGFSLAASWVWGDEYELVSFVEMDKFCQRWLRANWPGCRIIDKAEDVTYESLLADTDRNGTKRNQPEYGEGGGLEQDNSTIDLLTGGPPCQPVSVAGQRRGDSDERWQWPTMFRIIQDVAPKWFIFENVAGLLNFNEGILFDGILTDMEDAGYETTAFVLPACSQNAPHRRERVFVVGNSSSQGLSVRRMQPGIREKEMESSEGKAINGSSQGNVSDTHKPIAGKGRIQRSRKLSGIGCNSWADSEYITGHDGKQRRVKPGIRLLANGFPNRNDLLRGFGNAIVPQVVVPIMQAIKELNQAVSLCAVSATRR